ncbi:hypothetical protein K469DRAFT_162794 [Zopfia rhizophila CBS 207.26]|uniref:Cwf18 pre-mRNA splicing factor n=1 Tax=Zopfia rhizophila CBS 207.26 TaxID=1314779 RepID=A0A6A6E114_9PEZI|nr:hypothetical protein K469DRAFT_162794 [Zopfia rhizophila CBS 207.26]
MSSHDTLSAASNDRKARLAHLKSLKRKQAPIDDDPLEPSPSTTLVSTSSPPSDATTSYLSGRNYDPLTRSAKLGFDSAPVGDQTSTLEYKAEQLALESKKEEEAEKDEKPLDLFKLQPKKPNWDLKRDLEEKARVLDVWTETAIARLVRERVEGQRKKMVEAEGGKNGEGKKGEGEGGEEVGMEGSELVEAMHLKEREEELQRKREEDEDEDVS